MLSNEMRIHMDSTRIAMEIEALSICCVFLILLIYASSMLIGE